MCVWLSVHYFRDSTFKFLTGVWKRAMRDLRLVMAAPSDAEAILMEQVREKRTEKDFGFFWSFFFANSNSGFQVELGLTAGNSIIRVPLYY